jgi:hypothetical protein
MSPDEINQFVTLARKYLTNEYPRIADLRLDSAQYADMWHLVRGVEAAVRLRNFFFKLELEEIDRDLAGCLQFPARNS